MNTSLELKKVALEDLEWLRIQRNRSELMRYFRQTTEISRLEQESWFAGLKKENSRLFVVYSEGFPVGYVSLNPIDWRHAHAEFSIFVVPEHQGEGIGRKALLELLKLGFEGLKLHKIYSDVLDYPGEERFNFYKTLGFKEDGVHFQHYLKEGKWVDSIAFSMLEDEFFRLYGKEYSDRLGIWEKIGGSFSKKEGQSFSYNPG